MPHRLRYIDLKCPECGCEEERFIDTNDDGTPIDPDEFKCGEVRYDLDGHAYERGEYKDRDDLKFIWGDFTEDPPKVICIATMKVMDTAARVKTIVKGNHDYNERERERLEKRRDERFKTHGYAEKMDRIRTMEAKAKRSI